MTGMTSAPNTKGKYLSNSMSNKHSSNGYSIRFGKSKPMTSKEVARKITVGDFSQGQNPFEDPPANEFQANVRQTLSRGRQPNSTMSAMVARKRIKQEPLKKSLWKSQ